MGFKDHLDKIGIAGSFIAAACCLGLPALLSIMTAIGLGFIIRDSVLAPLMIAFLGVTLAGMYLGYRIHHRPWALLLASISSAAAFVFVFVHANRLAAYSAIAGLVLASILNVTSRQSSARTMRDRHSA